MSVETNCYTINEFLILNELFSEHAKRGNTDNLYSCDNRDQFKIAIIKNIKLSFKHNKPLDIQYLLNKKQVSSIIDQLIDTYNYISESDHKYGTEENFTISKNYHLTQEGCKAFYKNYINDETFKTIEGYTFSGIDNLTELSNDRTYKQMINSYYNPYKFFKYYVLNKE